ncbi:MAG TPA: hypothetical protein ENO24_00215, partial [Chloroflexi bacterium]|nr:hypothetical protein [Chloroflexota bacterium]
RDQPFAQVVVPDHKEFDSGTLRGMIRHAGLSADEFLELLSFPAADPHSEPPRLDPPRQDHGGPQRGRLPDARDRQAHPLLAGGVSPRACERGGGGRAPHTTRAQGLHRTPNTNEGEPDLSGSPLRD